eukprot:366224-Chlamydomonas_euryale.AAC.3
MSRRVSLRPPRTVRKRRHTFLQRSACRAEHPRPRTRKTVHAWPRHALQRIHVHGVGVGGLLRGGGACMC